MRKYVLLLVSLILLVIIAIPVLAAGPASYESTVNITNASSSSGMITLDYYDTSGVVTASYTETISGYETKFYSTLPALSGSFDGSMIVSADVPIVSNSQVIGQDGSDDPMNYASYIGFSSGSPNVYLPLLMDENYGFSTHFSVQNTGKSNVDVNITYNDGVTNTITALAPGASARIDNKAEVHTKAVLTAILESTGEIAVVAVEYGEDEAYGTTLYAYNGFGSGTSDPFFGLVNENNAGYWTGIPIQNLGDVDTDVTLQYTPNGLVGTACTETRTILAGKKKIFATYAFFSDAIVTDNDCVMGETFVGVATVLTNTLDQPIVGVVNQLNEPDNTGEALMSLTQESATSTVLYPEVYQWYGTEHWWSGIVTINLSGYSLPIGDITCRAIGTNGSGAVDVTWSNLKVIDNNRGWTKILYLDKPDVGNGFIGSVTCTSATGKIAGITNMLAPDAPAGVDSFAVYEGINVTP